MKKTLLKLALVIALISTSTKIFSQSKWNKKPTYSPLLEKTKLKTIDYKNTDYTAIGNIYKKQFLNGQLLTFLNKETQDTIIHGRYFIESNLSFIDGVWKQKTKYGTTYSYGIFQVNNNENTLGINSNPKNGETLLIDPKDIFLFKGFRKKYPANLEIQNDGNYLLTINFPDRNEEHDYSKIEIEVNIELIDEYGFFAIDDFILHSQYVIRYYNNGDKFIGKVKTILSEDGYFQTTLQEGLITHKYGESESEELKKLTDGNYLYTKVYANRKSDNIFAKMEMSIDKALIEKFGYWAIGDCFLNTSIVKYTYMNGNVFTGKQEQTIDTIDVNNININSQLTEGNLKYATGEEFNGDISGNWFCGIPINGTMKFIDGLIENGNWLLKYNLTDNEIPQLDSIISPTEKRKKAESLYNKRAYNLTINKAKIALSDKNYNLAKEHFIQARNYIPVDILTEYKNKRGGLADAFREPTKADYVEEEISKIDKIIEHQKKRGEYITKYGKHYGTLINDGKLEVGMTKEMVSEVLIKVYIISQYSRYGNYYEEWKLNGSRINLNAGTYLSDSELANLLKIPRKVIFTNNKLTDIYR